MSIACGTCHQRHETVADVRACSEHGAERHTAATTPIPSTVPTTPQDRCSEKQYNFMVTLEQRKLPEEKRHDPQDLQRMTFKRAKTYIPELLAMPDRQPRKQESGPDVPEGRYAVEVDGTLKFYQVDKPTEGRWAGYTFLKVQASDETYGIRDPKTRKFIMDLIAQDPGEAMLRYGREIGKCGHCGRTLTNKESRDAGIGPVCAGKFSTMFPEDSLTPEWTLS